MYKIGLLLVFFSVIVTGSAQQIINDPNAEVRTVASFHAIQASNAFEIMITQSDEEKLAVSAADVKYLPYITTRVENGSLKIKYEESNKLWGQGNRKLRAYIGVKNLDEVKASGATEIKIADGLTASSLSIDLSGASKLNGKLTITGKLSLELSGASDVAITGTAPELSIRASGASDVRAYDFSAGVAKVSASGACTIRISVDKELSADVSGASSVSYRGSATVKAIRTSGAGSVNRKS